jgi:gluconate 5-dehydrogenase
MSKLELKDKVALITGGAGGIGKCIAKAYAEAGAKVVVAGRTQKNLDRVASEIRALGREALAVATDVTVPEQVDNMVKQTVDKFGRLDIMVNNAGRGQNPTKPEELSYQDWNEIIALNLTGVFLGSTAAARVMIEQKSGKIINIASTAGIKGDPGMVHYSAAKAGVIILSRNLADAWAEHNINVNCIAPGLTATEGIKNWGILPPETFDPDSPTPRLHRPPDPENVADLALFLASSASDLITGELMVIRGSFSWDR